MLFSSFPHLFTPLTRSMCDDSVLSHYAILALLQALATFPPPPRTRGKESSVHEKRQHHNYLL